MSKARTTLALLAAGAAGFTACAGSAGLPGDTVALVTPLSLGPPPIYALIGYRDELELTSNQIAALDRIAQAFEEDNLPLIEELQGTTRRTRTVGQLVVRTEGEDLLKQIRDNQTEAVGAVEEVLTEEQREEVCRLYGLEDDEERGLEHRRTERRDTAAENRLVKPIGWQWCSEERPEPAPELRAGPV